MMPGAILSRAGAVLKRVPVLGDYVDGRASSREGKASIPQWLAASLPPLLTYVLAISDFLNRLLEGFQGMALGLRAALPLLLVIVGLIGLTARQEFTTRKASFWQYRSPRHIRLIAKVSLPLLVILTGARVWSVMPSRLTGTDMISGYLCLDSGGPLRGYVELLDAAGNPIAQRREEVESDGHFYVQAQPWKMSPVALHVQGEGGCSASISLDKGSITREACPGEVRWRAPERPEEERIWFVICDKS